MLQEATIITYLSSSKQDIVNNNNSYSFNILPFYLEWNGQKGEINRIEIKNDGTRYDGEGSDKKNFEKYQKYAPNVSQTDSWLGGEVKIFFAEGVAKAKMVGQTLIIDGSHWVDFWKDIYLDYFELVEIEDWIGPEGDSKLILKIKERKITTSGFSPTITSLLINFGDKTIERNQYKANLQVGKKYCFSERLKNAKILVDKRLELNNIPEIRIWKEEPEIIIHDREQIKIKKIFIELGIKKVTFENNILTITFNNYQTTSPAIEQTKEQQEIKEFCLKYNKREILREELGIDFNTPVNPNKYQLAICLIVLGVMVVWILFYLVRKRKK